MKILKALVIVSLAVITTNAAAAGKDSYYDLPIPFTDQSDRPFALSSLRGQYVVLTMAYTSCKNACPLTMQRLKRIESDLLLAGKKAAIVVVTLDPEHDTGKELRGYVSTYKISTPPWHLLRAAPDDTRRFSMIPGVSFQKQPGTPEITHSNKIVLLDPDGAPIAEVEGLASDTKPIVEAIQKR